LLLQEFDGSVYLFGYAVEMWLKAVCLRLRGHGPTVQVKAALPPLKTWMKANAPSVPFGDYHDLSALARAVMALRQDQGRPLPLPLLTELGLRIAGGMHDGWIVDMRYRRSGLSAADAWAALLSAWWLRSHWPQLT
jgi:hypothetical protein